MLKSVIRIVVGGVCGLVFVNSASAALYHFDVNMDPFQEVPPHNTPAYGSADFTFDSSSNTLSVDAGSGQYADLLAGSTTVRLQDAAPGSNGPTVFLLTLDSPGNTTGTFSGSGTLTAPQFNDLTAGSLYVNIADSVFPSGEIRGQLTSVPEPTSLTALAAVGLLSIRRPRRSRMHVA